MNNFTEWELHLIHRALMLLTFVLQGRESEKCFQLAEKFASDLRVKKQYGDSL